MIDLRNSSASDRGRPSTFQINNRLARTLTHTVTNTPFVCSMQKNLQTITCPNKRSSVYQLHCESSSPPPPPHPHKMFFCTCFAWVLQSPITKSLKYRKGDPTIKLQLSTFRWQHSLEPTTQTHTPTFSLTSNRTWFPNTHAIFNEAFLISCREAVHFSYASTYFLCENTETHLFGD